MLPPDPARESSGVAEQLAGTQPWVRFMSIIAFVYVGLMILGGLIAGGVLLASDRPEAIVMLFVYPLLGVLYIYPALCLFRYANGIRAYLGSRHESDLVHALDAQRAFWKFLAILTAIGIALGLAVAVLAALLGAVLGIAATGAG